MTTTALADLVVEALNATDWERPFHARRSWMPLYELEKIDQLVVEVVPEGVAFTAATRASDYHDSPIDVVLLHKPASGAQLHIPADAQAELVERIAQHFRQSPGRLLAEGTVAVTGVEIPILIERTHFEQYRQLTSVIRLTLRTRG